MREIIRKKRDGEALSAEEIGAWIGGVTDHSVPDYQSSALLMAITIRGMGREETTALTEAMLHSGRVLDWSKLGRPTIDKHSTGGVGDKVSIALAPWVASCGAAVPMICGRGLGHTGGTLDKLESVVGFRSQLTPEEFSAQIAKIGVVIAGASEGLAPADGALYALRDVTATVESRPLIVASILSKKLAAGASAIVFDVKCGGGAFMRTRDEARALAHELVQTSTALGRKARALITAMDQPLGFTVGNASETAEAFAVLRGEGPPDLVELTRGLATTMLVLSGVARERFEAEARLDRALDSGEALRRAESMLQSQRGDPRVVSDPTRLPKAATETRVLAPRPGFVSAINARALGELLITMGGGRRRKEDKIDPAVGIRLLHKVGDRVEGGEALAIVDAHQDAPDWALAVRDAYGITPERPEPGPMILEQIDP
jgi:pyrimidine-nucleoside phosphorylase/thymidine phosphorylase